MIMLEDNLSDVIGKALMGHGMAWIEVAKLAKLESPGVDIVGMSANDLRAIAGVLGLNAEALVNHSVYDPKPLAVDGVLRLKLPFDGEHVNVWLIQKDGQCVLFDTGMVMADMIAALPSCPERVFITHAHRDHIGGMAYFQKKQVIVHACGIAGAEPMSPGDVIVCGRLTIRACDLSGHATPALGYHIDGLDAPVLVVGDALFAGSIGRCRTPESYRHALMRMRDVFGPLPDHTVLLPGHGPATTLGEERRSNPFL